jgi:hypothetical protein
VKAGDVPLSRPFQAAAATPDGVAVAIRANNDERAALARANSLAAVESFEADLRVARWGAEGLDVSGVLRARVRQTCVVTLEDFDAAIDTPIHVRFAPPVRPATPAHGARDGRARAKASFDDEEDGGSAQIVDLDADAPDELVGGAVDLGAVAAEFLTLNLDPYPRRPGVAFVEPEPAEARESPFATLARKLAPKGGKAD